MEFRRNERVLHRGEHAPHLVVLSGPEAYIVWDPDRQQERELTGYLVLDAAGKIQCAEAGDLVKVTEPRHIDIPVPWASCGWQPNMDNWLGALGQEMQRLHSRASQLRSPQ